MTRIAVDAMSGDHGAPVAVEAVMASLRAHPDLEIIVVGDADALNKEIARHRKADVGDRLTVQHAAEVVGMCESPARSLRQKKDSSMRVSINLVQQGSASACVSAGNTGALMATARFVLKTLAGIDRPAIVSPIPSRRGHTLMLDLGANAEHPEPGIDSQKTTSPAYRLGDRAQSQRPKNPEVKNIYRISKLSQNVGGAYRLQGHV